MSVPRGRPQYERFGYGSKALDSTSIPESKARKRASNAKSCLKPIPKKLTC